MKKTNKKLITLLLSGMLGVAALGVGAMKTDAVSAADAETTKKYYTLTDVFYSDATGAISADNENGANATAQTTKFTLSKGESVEFRRNLALKWFDEVDGTVGAQYFSMKFALADTNFENLSIVLESESASANADNKATNKVTFKKVDETKLSVWVNDVKSETEIAVADAKAGITLALSETEGADYGVFDVVLNGTVLQQKVIENGKEKVIALPFENIGANYAAYTSGKVTPLSIISEKEETEENEPATAAATDTVVYLYELNNQRFNNIIEESEKMKVPDTAAPVIVINDKIADGLLIGTAFAYYSPTVIDVMPSSDAKITGRSFYQWNPTDTSVVYNTEMKSSHYFMDTTYYCWKYYLADDGSTYETEAEAKASGKTYKKMTVNYATETEAKESGKPYEATTVYKENNNTEFLSVKYAVQDDAMELNESKKEYQLAWYAEGSAKTDMPVGEENVSCIHLNKKNDGAFYTYITLGEDENGEGINVITNQAALDDEIKAYQSALEKAAQEASAGSNSYIYYPSLSWLIGDNNGYRNLKFVICYKSPSSSTGKSTSPLSYNGLRLSTTDEGYYEFKVYATDAAGNGMEYYLDGELVKVNATNIWEIEEIPTFSYVIERKGVSIKNDSDTTTKRKDDVEYNGKFTGYSDPTVVGMVNKQSAYALYKVDLSAYNSTIEAGKPQLTLSLMSGITYASLKSEIDAQFKAGNIPEKGEYFDFYLDLYAKKLASKVAGSADAIKACFVRIDEYDSTITEEDVEWATNKFKWNSSSKTFEAVENCNYLILADYYEKDLATQRVMAYKVIEIEEEEYTHLLKTKWIKDNITSVVLFAVAGVMFVMIIILLLVKPSEETLEEVETAADEENAKKKNKKNRK